MKLGCGVALLAVLAIAPLHGQFSGRLTGLVVDGSGASVPGAEIGLLLSGGAKPLLTTKTSTDGIYHFIGVRPGQYDITVESPGFLKTTVRAITVDISRETAVPTVKLQLAVVNTSVDVAAPDTGVDLTSAEIAGTISIKEITNLPLLDRDVLGVLQTQPGVVYNGNSTTVINGLRTSYSNVTVDGVNVQDNYIRDNALDYLPNKLLLGQVSEMTVVSSNQSSAAFGGATQTALSTPSGNNKIHGNLLWFNRNTWFAANDWFNNQSGVDRSRLNQNQFGGTVAGPIKKDKLFYHFNYEGIRAHQQVGVVGSILSAPARTGVFSYLVGGEPRSVNLLSLRGLTGVDPVIQALIDKTPSPTARNSEVTGDARNTYGVRFNQRDNETRDNLGGRVDFNLSTKHAFSGSYLHNRDNQDRPDAGNGFVAIPTTYNPTHADLVAGSWRSTPTSRITNVLEGGMNLTYGYFKNSQEFGPYIIAGLAFSNPINTFRTQGRNTNTYNLSNTTAYQTGKHYIQFGFHAQNIRVETYDEAGTIPVFSLGMGFGQQALTRSNLPGISTTDLSRANSLLATLGGYINGASQSFNVTSRTSGFVSGAPYLRHLKLNDYAFFVQDKFRIHPRLTVGIGLRYQLPGVTDERDSLELLPVQRGTLLETLLSDATFDFAGKSVGRPLYNRKKTNFAPNIDFAWDPFGHGKTVLRGGYAMSYVNDQEILSTENMASNAGLQQSVIGTALSNRIATGVPKIVTPTFAVPRKASDNQALDPYSVITSIDPNLNRPYVQQYAIGIQHEFKSTIFEARYVGNHVVGAYRAFDYNQVHIADNGFLADFNRARSNGFLAAARNGIFNPNYNVNIPGSQPLTVFPQLAGAGLLTDPNVQYLLQTGEAGDLAKTYWVNGLQGSVNFFPNPNALAADVLTNYSHSSYNSLQLVARRQLRSGLTFNVNYTWSKVLSDADGDSQSRFQAFLDFNNTRIERSRANFDLNHVIKASGTWDLPLGAGHRLRWKPLDHVIGGWRFGGIMIWQSGAPFSILSGRGTLNRYERSYYNTASTLLKQSQMKDVVKFQMTGNGPFIINPSAVNADDGSGVNIDGEPFFQGQVFFNPAPGGLGALQRRYFSGPWTFNLDTSLGKAFKFRERHAVQIRMDAFNAFNHATFWPGDQNINSTYFGYVADTFYAPRNVQFQLLYSF